MVGNILYLLKSVFKLGDGCRVYRALPYASSRTQMIARGWCILLSALSFSGAFALIGAKLVCALSHRNRAFSGMIANKAIDVMSYSFIAVIFVAFMTVVVLEILIKRHYRKDSRSHAKNIKHTKCTIHNILQPIKYKNVGIIDHCDSSIEQVRELIRNKGADNELTIAAMPQGVSSTMHDSQNYERDHKIECSRVMLIGIIACGIITTADIIRRLRRSDGSYIIPPICKIISPTTGKMSAFSIDIIDIIATVAFILLISANINTMHRAYQKYKKYHNLSIYNKWRLHPELMLWQNKQHANSAKNDWIEFSDITQERDRVKICIISTGENSQGPIADRSLRKRMEYSVPTDGDNPSTSIVRGFLSTILFSPFDYDMYLSSH